MNISIIINSINHHECIGFLADCLVNNNVTVYYNTYIYNWLNYFKKIYDFKIKKNRII